MERNQKRPLFLAKYRDLSLKKFLRYWPFNRFCCLDIFANFAWAGGVRLMPYLRKKTQAICLQVANLFV
jgi:hypothetical protein